MDRLADNIQIFSGGPNNLDANSQYVRGYQQYLIDRVRQVIVPTLSNVMIFDTWLQQKGLQQQPVVPPSTASVALRKPVPPPAARGISSSAVPVVPLLEFPYQMDALADRLQIYSGGPRQLTATSPSVQGYQQYLRDRVKEVIVPSLSNVVTFDVWLQVQGVQPQAPVVQSSRPGARLASGANQPTRVPAQSPRNGSPRNADAEEPRVPYMETLTTRARTEERARQAVQVPRFEAKKWGWNVRSKLKLSRVTAVEHTPLTFYALHDPVRSSLVEPFRRAMLINGSSLYYNSAQLRSFRPPRVAFSVPPRTPTAAEWVPLVRRCMYAAFACILVNQTTDMAADFQVLCQTLLESASLRWQQENKAGSETGAAIKAYYNQRYESLSEDEVGLQFLQDETKYVLVPHARTPWILLPRLMHTMTTRITSYALPYILESSIYILELSQLSKGQEEEWLRDPLQWLVDTLQTDKVFFRMTNERREDLWDEVIPDRKDQHPVFDPHLVALMMEVDTKCGFSSLCAVPPQPVFALADDTLKLSDNDIMYWVRIIGALHRKTPEIKTPSNLKRPSVLDLPTRFDMEDVAEFFGNPSVADKWGRSFDGAFGPTNSDFRNSLQLPNAQVGEWLSSMRTASRVVCPQHLVGRGGTLLAWIYTYFDVLRLYTPGVNPNSWLRFFGLQRLTAGADEVRSRRIHCAFFLARRLVQTLYPRESKRPPDRSILLWLSRQFDQPVDLFVLRSILLGPVEAQEVQQDIQERIETLVDTYFNNLFVSIRPVGGRAAPALWVDHARETLVGCRMVRKAGPIPDQKFPYQEGHANYADMHDFLDDESGNASTNRGPQRSSSLLTPLRQNSKPELADQYAPSAKKRQTPSSQPARTFGQRLGLKQARQRALQRGDSSGESPRALSRSASTPTPRNTPPPRRTAFPETPQDGEAPIATIVPAEEDGEPSAPVLDATLQVSATPENPSGVAYGAIPGGQKLPFVRSTESEAAEEGRDLSSQPDPRSQASADAPQSPERVEDFAPGDNRGIPSVPVGSEQKADNDSDVKSEGTVSNPDNAAVSVDAVMDVAAVSNASGSDNVWSAAFGYPRQQDPFTNTSAAYKYLALLRFPGIARGEWKTELQTVLSDRFEVTAPYPKKEVAKVLIERPTFARLGFDTKPQERGAIVTNATGRIVNFSAFRGVVPVGDNHLVVFRPNKALLIGTTNNGVTTEAKLKAYNKPLVENEKKFVDGIKKWIPVTAKGGAVFKVIDIPVKDIPTRSGNIEARIKAMQVYLPGIGRDFAEFREYYLPGFAKYRAALTRWSADYEEEKRVREEEAKERARKEEEEKKRKEDERKAAKEAREQQRRALQEERTRKKQAAQQQRDANAAKKVRVEEEKREARRQEQEAKLSSLIGGARREKLATKIIAEARKQIEAADFFEFNEQDLPQALFDKLVENKWVAVIQEPRSVTETGRDPPTSSASPSEPAAPGLMLDDSDGSLGDSSQNSGEEEDDDEASRGPSQGSGARAKASGKSLMFLPTDKGFREVLIYAVTDVDSYVPTNRRRRQIWINDMNPKAVETDPETYQISLAAYRHETPVSWMIWMWGVITNNAALDVDPVRVEGAFSLPPLSNIVGVKFEVPVLRDQDNKITDVLDTENFYERKDNFYTTIPVHWQEELSKWMPAVMIMSAREEVQIPLLIAMQWNERFWLQTQN